jgi:hypothetical protein
MGGDIMQAQMPIPRMYLQFAEQMAQNRGAVAPAPPQGEGQPDMMQMLMTGILPGLGGSFGQGAMGGLLPMLAAKKIPGLLGGA